MKTTIASFLILLALLISGNSCSVRKSASMPAPAPSVKAESAPDKSEPVPGAEILIEQDNNKPLK